MSLPTPPSPAWPDRLASLAGVITSLALGCITFSLRLPPPPAPAGTNSALPAASALVSCGVEPAGYWRGRVSGSATLSLDWTGNGLACAGNARPDGRGLRLFFAGHPPGSDQRLVIVLGIAAPVDELAGHEWPASLTVIDEASSSFFHGTAGRCFTQVTEVTPLGTAGRSFRVAGELYCAGALGAVNGEQAITLGDSRYAGRVDLEGP